MARTNGSSSARNTSSRGSRRASSSSSSDSSGNRRANSSSDWSSGVIDLARDRPIAAAAVAAGAAAAGLFMWSKRSQISNQLSNLSAQIGDWTQNAGSDNLTSKIGDDTGGLTTSSSNARSGAARSASRGMSDTGGGNGALGSVAGGAGTRPNASGRGRAQSTAATQE